LALYPFSKSLGKMTYLQQKEGPSKINELSTLHINML